MNLLWLDNVENKLQFNNADANKVVLSVLYLGHSVKKWISSSILPMVQLSHSLASGGTYLFLLLYLPVSIFSLCALRRNLARFV